jgi:hypothetical protein
MPLCGNCGNPLTCKCGPELKLGSLDLSCPKPGCLWVHVVNDLGKPIPRMSVLAVKPEKRLTDVSGLVLYENVPQGSYKVELRDERKPEDQLEDLPPKPVVTHEIKNGTVTQVFFELKRKAKLRVKVVGETDILVDAKVYAKHIVSQSVDGRQTKLSPALEGKCVDGRIDFGYVACRQYRIGVILAGLKREDYDVDEVDIDLGPGEDQTVTLHVEVIFKKVRFIGYCLATVTRQLWSGDNKLVEEFKKSVESKSTDPKVIYDWWDKKAEPASAQWKVLYNGLRNDREDIEARISALQSAIALAESKVGADPTELKIFMAPECFFLSLYGAYLLDGFDHLISRLQEITRDPKWKSWLFVFGTVNCCYQLEDDKWEMFNTAPVIKGGFGGSDASAFTLLRRKQVFSQEIPGDEDLIRTDAVDRVQLTEELVGMGFGPTENEIKLAGYIQKLLKDVPKLPNPLVADLTTILDWEYFRWAEIREGARADIKGRGMVALVDDLKNSAFGPEKQWFKDFRTGLKVELEKADKETVEAEPNLEKYFLEFRKKIRPATAASTTGVALSSDRWKMVRTKGNGQKFSSFAALIRKIQTKTLTEEWENDFVLGFAGFLGKDGTTIETVLNEGKFKERAEAFLACILETTVGTFTGMHKSSSEWVAIGDAVDEEVKKRGLPAVLSKLRKDFVLEKQWMKDLCEALKGMGKDIASEPDLGAPIEQILGTIEQEESIAGCAGFSAARWKILRENSENKINSLGMTRFVRGVREVAITTVAYNEKFPDANSPWMDDLRFVLREKLPEDTEPLHRKQRGQDFRYEDYCFGMRRIHSPWLSDVVFPGGEIEPARKLNFVLETCADHLNSKAAEALSSLSPKPAIDIHLVPSAGAQLSSPLIQGKGFAFNCDGWNAPKFAAGPRQREALVITHVVSDEYPYSSGHNPLFPHSEVWSITAGKRDTVKGTPHKLKLDLHKIFALEKGDGGEVHVYPTQELPTT